MGFGTTLSSGVDVDGNTYNGVCPCSSDCREQCSVCSMYGVCINSPCVSCVSFQIL